MKISNFSILKRDNQSIIFNPENINPLFIPNNIDGLIKLLKNGEYLNNDSLVSILKRHFIIEDSSSIAIKTRSVGNSIESNVLQSSCQHPNATNSKNMYLLLSQSCNQACIYCLNGNETYQKRNNLKMDLNTTIDSIDQIAISILDTGTLNVIFFGGEPLMNWSLAKEIIKYCEKNIRQRINVKYHLTTNLTILPDDLIAYTQKYNISILVNIDGPEEIHNITRPFRGGGGSFSTTVNNAKLFSAAGIKLYFRSTITRYNHHKMIEIALLHKELGGATTAFVPLNPVDSDNHVFPIDLCPDLEIYTQGLRDVFHSGVWEIGSFFPFSEYLHKLKIGYKNKHSCGAPFGNTPVISVDGKIYSCIYLVGNDKYLIGELNKHNYPIDDKVDEMLDEINVDNLDDCKICPYRYLCSGGCPVNRYSVKNAKNIPEDIKKYSSEVACATSKTIIEELFWSLAKKRTNAHTIS